VTDPVVISSMGKDKLSTSIAIQEQVSLYDIAAEGKIVIIHSTLSRQKTGTLLSNYLAVQNICLLRWVLPAIPASQLHSANGKLEGGFQVILLLFSLKAAIQ